MIAAAALTSGRLLPRTAGRRPAGSAVSTLRTSRAAVGGARRSQPLRAAASPRHDGVDTLSNPADEPHSSVPLANSGELSDWRTPADCLSCGQRLAAAVTSASSHHGSVYFLSGAEQQQDLSESADAGTFRSPDEAVASLLARLGATVTVSGNGVLTIAE